MNSQPKTNPAVLAASCEFLVLKLARVFTGGRRGWAVNYRTHDELVEIGRNVVLAAAETFDPTRGVQFSTYAHGVARRAMYRHVHRKARREWLESQAERHKPRPVADPDLAIDLADAVAKLPDRQRQTFNAWVQSGFQPAEAAKLLGITRGGFLNRITRIRAAIQESLSAYKPEMERKPIQRRQATSSKAEYEQLRRLRQRRKLAA